VSDNALVTAATAVVGITIRVGLTPVGRVCIAVTKRLLAVRNTTHAYVADGRSIRRIWANVLASIAIVYADLQVHFATIGHIGITAGKARVTGNAARPTAATRYPVGAVARGAAGAAIAGIG